MMELPHQSECLIFTLMSALLLAWIQCTTAASNQHLICKSVNDLFSEGDSGTRHEINGTIPKQVVQGRPGKIGPVGPRGSPGPRGSKGDAGYVDYNNISEIVERKVCEGLSAIAYNLKTLQEDVSDIQINLKERLNCMASGFLYNETCYSLPHISRIQDLNRAGAIQTCRDIGAEMVEVYDKTQQFALTSFLRPKIPPSVGLLYLWTGMTYDRKRAVIGYRSGREASTNQLLWWPGHPGSSLRHVIFGVHKSSAVGIWNDAETSHRHGVICEKKL